MNAIQELFKNSASWTTVIFVVLVLLFAIKEIISVISYICEKFGIKTKRITEKENFEKRVNKLEQHDERQYNELNELISRMTNLMQVVNNMQSANLTENEKRLLNQINSIILSGQQQMNIVCSQYGMQDDQEITKSGYGR